MELEKEESNTLHEKGARFASTGAWMSHRRVRVWMWGAWYKSSVFFQGYTPRCINIELMVMHVVIVSML